MIGGLSDAIVALGGAGEAFFRAVDRDEVAQRVATESRADARLFRRRKRWAKLVSKAVEDLLDADRRDDVDGLVASVLVLRHLGIDREDFEEAQTIAARLLSDG